MSEILLVIAILVGCALLIYLIRRREDVPSDIISTKEKEIQKEKKKINEATKEHNETLKKQKEESKEKPHEETIKGFNDMFGNSDSSK